MQKISLISPQFLGTNTIKSEVNNTQKTSNNLERSPESDILEKGDNKKKIIIALGAIIAAITALACFIKHRSNKAINPQSVIPPKDTTILEPPHKANIGGTQTPGNKIEEGLNSQIQTPSEAPSTEAIAAKEGANPSKTNTPSENKAPEKLNNQQSTPEASSIADASAEDINKSTPIEEIKPGTAGEAEKPTPTEDAAKAPEAAIQPKVQIPEFVFDEKVFSDLKDYKKVLFSNNPSPISNELIERCKKEQTAIEQAYLELDALFEQNKGNEAITDKIVEKIDEIAVEYKKLNYAKTAQEINKLKSKLDSLDPKAYEKIVQELKDKYNEKGVDYLYYTLLEEVGKKTFKTSPVYEELLKATRELGIQGKDDKEKISKLIEMASDDCIGEGVQGSAYHIPNTNLAIKVRSGRASQALKSLDIDSLQYVADISEYDAVNNILAKNDSAKVEIQEYIDGIKGVIAINDDAQRVISDMPQSTYDDLLARIVRINKAGRGIDSGAANLVVDAVNCRIVPIDLHPNTSFEAGYRTKIDELGRNYIDPLAHTVGDCIPGSMNSALQLKRIGKVLKSIAHDTENYEMYLFDTGFYSKIYGHEAESTIKKTIISADRALEPLANEVDNAFNKMHQTKLKYLNSGNIEDKKKMDEAIEEFCSFIDKKLLTEPDLAPSELAKLQIKINKEHKHKNLKYTVNLLEKKIKRLSQSGELTEDKISRKLEMEKELEEAKKILQEFEKHMND